MLQIKALATDLYEFTMAAGYFLKGFADTTATFELFVRKLPPKRNFLISCGQEIALDFIQNYKLTPEEIEYLRSLPVLKEVPREFFSYLEELRFSGEVWAMPEGTPVFPGEPILRVTAPIIQAQILETALLSIINHSTAIASKAIRVVLAAKGKPVIEFGSRRAHGPQAGVLGARASYVAGCDGTSNLEAGRIFKIPVFGTVAHSWIQAFEDEYEAFEANLSALPSAGVMLIDTYDTIQGAKNAIKLGKSLRSVRIDSGDLITDSKRVRRMLDKAGLRKVSIFLSGDLDEYRVHEILRANAPADAFGVGTRMSVSVDSPVVNGVYKLVEVIKGGEPHGRIKLSTGKILYPGRKQVFRYERRNKYIRDVIGAHDEELPGNPSRLLVQIFAKGKRIRRAESLELIRQRVRQAVEKLPRGLLALEKASPYKVTFSQELKRQLRIAEVEMIK